MPIAGTMLAEEKPALVAGETTLKVSPWPKGSHLLRAIAGLGRHRKGNQA